MNLFSFLPFASAVLSLLLAVASVMRKRQSLATWCFFTGMVVLGLDSLCTGLSLRATSLPDVLRWLTRGLVAESLLPAAWLGFSLTYSRGDYREVLASWRLPFAILALLPIGLAFGAGNQLLQFGPVGPSRDVLLLQSGVMARALNAVLLVAFVLALMNLEQTFRSVVGTMRWRIKFVVLGLAVIFGAQIYVRSQAILYSVHDMAQAGVEASGLLIGCAFLALAHARTGFAEIDVYPSRAVLRSSLTVVIVGTYLFIVGVLAQVVRRFGGADSFQLQALVLLVGMAGLAVLLLSDRLRQRVQEFVGRHFSKAQHDSALIWTEFSRQLANVSDRPGLCGATARLVSGTFDVLSVSVWLLDPQDKQLFVSAATAGRTGETGGGERLGAPTPMAIETALRERTAPFDIEGLDEQWAEDLRCLNPTTFPNGGHRWCVPLRSGTDILGVIVLADRVNGAPYSLEERELLQCIADQMSSVLVNLRLVDDVARGRELEAFRTMSAFFVHDLKNATSSLNLTLKNLPVHFDDPEFRADALRGIGNTVRRIDEMIARLSTLRQRPETVRTEADLNQIVRDAVGALDHQPEVEIAHALMRVPHVLADREQIGSVVTNLLLNARDALGASGRIDVRTDHRGERVVLSVADTGCGMSPAFMRNSLFKPFQSTKTNGLGIGMFQSRRVVEAHGGSLHVESEVGVGTTVRVSLPAMDAEDTR